MAVHDDEVKRTEELPRNARDTIATAFPSRMVHDHSSTNRPLSAVNIPEAEASWRHFIATALFPDAAFPEIELPRSVAYRWDAASPTLDRPTGRQLRG